MPKGRGESKLGLIEWILIAILAILVLITLYMLLRPAISLYIQNLLESVQQ